MKILLYFCFVLLAGAVQVSHAENWIEIGVKPEVGGHVYHLDDESITPAGDGIYHFVWRKQNWSLDGSSLTDLHTEHVKAHCKQEILEIKKSISIDELGSQIKGRTIYRINDYKTGKRLYDGEEMFSDKSSKDLMLSVSHIYPTSTSLEGKVLQAVCKSEYYPRELREKYSVSFQKKAGCGAEETTKLPLCHGDESTLEFIYALRLRIDQLKSACITPIDQAELFLSNIEKNLGECRAEDKNCTTTLLRNYIYSIGIALTKAKVNNDCSWVEREIEKAKSDKARSESVARFKVCTKKAILELEDGTSPVEMIANSVISYCRPILNDTFPRSELFDQFAGLIRPQITTLIFQYRQVLRQTPAPKVLKKPKRYDS